MWYYLAWLATKLLIMYDYYTYAILDDTKFTVFRLLKQKELQHILCLKVGGS